MFREVELVREVVVESAGTSTSIIITKLLENLLKEKASKDHGYFLNVTVLSLKNLKGYNFSDNSGKMLFPIAFGCRTFIPCQGEVLEGVVHCVHNLGVFIRCGPLHFVYLSARKMPNYSYVDGKNPFFLKNDLAKIDKEVVVRFKVLSVKWIENSRGMRKEFAVIASIVGDSLGPVCGPHGSDL